MTQFQALPVGFLLPGNTWPEIFLMFVQFTGLVLLVSQLEITTTNETLGQPTGVSVSVHGLTSPGDTKVHLWGDTRDYFEYRPRWAVLTSTIGGVVSGCSFYTPVGKTFPILVARLRQRLLLEAIRLSGLEEVSQLG
jgi:hypothetical protein